MFLRRTFIASSLALLASAALSQPSSVLGSQPFRLVAPFPSGGPVDALARILATGLGEKYKQTAIVENLPGAAGNIGMDKVKRAAADGHTLLVIPAGNLTINPTLMRDFPFNVEQDFTPVSMLAKAPNVLVAHPSLAANNAKDLIALANNKSAKPLSFASPGVGSGLHLAGELFKGQTGVDMLHVPYKGSPQAVTDVIGGTVPLMFSNLPVVMAHIHSGKLKAIGVTDSVRTPHAPNIPTLQEQGMSGVVVTSWYGVLAPKGVSPATVTQLSRDIAEIMKKPAVLEQLKAQSLTPWSLSPAEFGSHIKAETATWARVIKQKNISLE